jgi:hypothetical protein
MASEVWVLVEADAAEVLGKVRSCVDAQDNINYGYCHIKITFLSLKTYYIVIK